MAQTLFDTLDLFSELRAKRTIQDLDILRRLCFSVGPVVPVLGFMPQRPYCPDKKLPTPTWHAPGQLDLQDSQAQLTVQQRNELVRNGRKDKFTSSRPFLIGRVPATSAGGFCETCFGLVDEVCGQMQC